jgi:hypothetical protein
MAPPQAPPQTGTLEKGTFYNADGGNLQEVVRCQFNPNEFTISRSNKWEDKKTAGSNARNVVFGGMGLRTLQMTLMFDSYEESGVSVVEKIEKLMALMDPPAGQPATAGARGNLPRPPHVKFGWGGFYSFLAVITQVSQKFTLFRHDGTPVRATLQVTLQEIPQNGVPAKDWAKGQNPTSQATGARRVRTVRPGETIDWIAAEELGDPGAWRLLAAANLLDDPRRLRAGQALLVPPEP